MQNLHLKSEKINIDFKGLFIDSPVAVYTCDRDGYITSYNQAASDLWGRSPEIGKEIWCGSMKIFYPNGSTMAVDECPMALTLKTGLPHEGREIVIERPDHSFRTLLVYPKPIFDKDDRLIGAHNTLVDITRYKTNEEQDAILSAIVESSDDAIVSKNLKGIITSWNKGAQKIFGYEQEEIVGKSIHVLIPEHLRNEEETIIKSIKAGNKIDHFQTVRVCKSGEMVHVSITVSPVKDRAGNIIGASKIARDISDHLMREKEIKQNSQRLEILNSIGKSISEKLDAQSILQKVTDATTKITGAAFGAFFYNTINEHGEAFMLYTLSGAPREHFEKFGMPRNTDVFHATFSGKSVVRSADITKDSRYGNNPPHYGMPKGHLPVVSYLAVPVFGSSGVLGGLFFGHPKPGMFTAEHEDIVVNIATQASVALENSRLFEQVKMLNARKDEFIALASHELKTPLTTIKGYLQILEKDEQDKMKKKFFEKTLDQVNRLNLLVTDLFDISKIESGKLQLNYEEFDMRLLLEETVDTFRHSALSHKIILEKGNPAIIEADKQRIEQVITNLLNNAIKYSPEGKNIYVELSYNPKEVLVKIRDEGIGLSDEQQQKIFTRFYRANLNSNIAGLGLGLYLSKEIITRHCGKIWVVSDIGRGAEFFFTLPVKQA